MSGSYVSFVLFFKLSLSSRVPRKERLRIFAFLNIRTIVPNIANVSLKRPILRRLFREVLCHPIRNLGEISVRFWLKSGQTLANFVSYYFCIVLYPWTKACISSLYRYLHLMSFEIMKLCSNVYEIWQDLFTFHK